MTHPGYFTDSMGSQPWYRCVQCAYDVFSKGSIEAHVHYSHPKINLPDMGLSREDWFKQQMARNTDHRIGIGFLTWNTAPASVPAAQAIAREVGYLELLGLNPIIIWVDNGSTDDTVQAVSPEFANLPQICEFSPTNEGQSKGRNAILEAATRAGCDYLLLVDGDVEVISFSAYAFYRFLQEKGTEKLGCIGMYSRNCTHVPDAEVAQECRKIDPWMVRSVPSIAWTNYGMFPAKAFEQCRFEDKGPFAGPGWGFEDDDFYLQMRALDLQSVSTQYFRHMHRRRHSSVKLIGETLAAKVHAERKAFLLNKWRDVPHAVSHLRLLENQTMPVLEY